jgi:hypothetical protein
MIPALTHAGVLPPFLPNTDPAISSAMAPYSVTLSEVVARFANTPDRIEIFRGLLGYRQLLRDAGITDGFQWIDGSYVEDCERNRGRSPSDIDLVTFAKRPSGCADKTIWGDFVKKNAALFTPIEIKRQHRCDAYFVDLDLPGETIVANTKYWFGLFSHQRSSFLWKGLLTIPLQADDQIALASLNGGDSYAP